MKLTSDELAKKRSSEEANLLKTDEDLYIPISWLGRRNHEYRFYTISIG